jgi:hypothetical protein
MSARFHQQARCIAVYVADRFVAYGWFCIGRYDEDEILCTYELRDPHVSAVDFDVYVFPQYRLSRAFGALWQALNETMADAGVKRTCSRISRLNYASFRAHSRLGGRRSGWVFAVKIFGVQLIISPTSPFPHFHLRRRRRLALSW